MKGPLFLSRTTGQFYCLEIAIGNTHKVVQNLHSLPQIGNVIKKEVCEVILRYANHRHRALKHYGQLDPQRAQSITRLQLRFGFYKTWHAHNLKAKILGAKEDLHAILPSTESRFYKSQSKLVHDLISLAGHYHAAEFTQA